MTRESRSLRSAASELVQLSLVLAEQSQGLSEAEAELSQLRAEKARLEDNFQKDAVLIGFLREQINGKRDLWMEVNKPTVRPELRHVTLPRPVAQAATNQASSTVPSSSTAAAPALAPLLLPKGPSRPRFDSNWRSTFTTARPPTGAPTGPSAAAPVAANQMRVVTAFPSRPEPRHGSTYIAQPVRNYSVGPAQVAARFAANLPSHTTWGNPSSLAGQTGAIHPPPGFAPAPGFPPISHFQQMGYFSHPSQQGQQQVQQPVAPTLVANPTFAPTIAPIVDSPPSQPYGAKHDRSQSSPSPPGKFVSAIVDDTWILELSKLFACIEGFGKSHISIHPINLADAMRTNNSAGPLWTKLCSTLYPAQHTTSGAAHATYILEQPDTRDYVIPWLTGKIICDMLVDHNTWLGYSAESDRKIIYFHECLKQTHRPEERREFSIGMADAISNMMKNGNKWPGFRHYKINIISQMLRSLIFPIIPNPPRSENHTNANHDLCAIVDRAFQTACNMAIMAVDWQFVWYRIGDKFVRTKHELAVIPQGHDAASIEDSQWRVKLVATPAVSVIECHGNSIIPKNLCKAKVFVMH